MEAAATPVPPVASATLATRRLAVPRSIRVSARRRRDAQRGRVLDAPAPTNTFPAFAPEMRCQSATYRVARRLRPVGTWTRPRVRDAPTARCGVAPIATEVRPSRVVIAKERHLSSRVRRVASAQRVASDWPRLRARARAAVRRCIARIATAARPSRAAPHREARGSLAGSIAPRPRRVPPLPPRLGAANGMTVTPFLPRPAHATA
jgi:hypothetical protein